VKQILERIRSHAERRPGGVAIGDELGDLYYGDLAWAIEGGAVVLDGERVGLLLDNGRHWAVADLALARRGALCVPMPGFFSDAQLGHLIRDADLDLVVTDDPGRVRALLGGSEPSRILLEGREVWLFRRRPNVGAAVPEGTAKVTYTSGTTGEPKGVCLSAEGIERATVALCESVGADLSDRALSVLPLSTLLENIGGLYAPLYAGARAQVPGLASVGVDGSSGVLVERLLAALACHAPTTLILVPQLLKALAGGIAAGLPRPASLRFVAVGGAPVSPTLIAEARALDLPVFQGYGLSEAASAVCLNLPGADRSGSVGRPLPHVSVSLSGEGEVLVEGAGFVGYLGGEPRAAGRWPTGDLGRLDEDGFLYLTGRRKSAYATAFGRNLAPEWVEGEFTSHPDILQAAVFGEGRPFNVAVIVPRLSDTPEAVAASVHAANARLPDYARVTRWVLADEPFTAGNGLATGAGSLRREAVGRRYRDRIESLYQGENRYVAL
jgi:long-subunit acyl-CoA synthetase (AMP-forming)